MSNTDRRRVLEAFEAQKDFYEQKVNEGIEKNRKGDARIRLTDESGAPIAGAKIKLIFETAKFFNAIYQFNGLF